MRVCYAVLFGAAVLLASANARARSKLYNHERKARSLVFTGEPPSHRFNPKYTPHSNVQKDYSPGQFSPGSEFSEQFDAQLNRNGKDYQVDTNNVDWYPDGDEERRDQTENDYDSSRKEDHSTSQEDHADYQEIVDMLKDLLHLKHNEEANDKKNYDDDDDDDDDFDDDFDDEDAVEDEDEDENEDEDEDDNTDDDDDDDDEQPERTFYPNGKDFDGMNDIDNPAQGNGQKTGNEDVEYMDGFARSPKDDPSPGSPAVPKSNNYYSESFYGQDDVDEDFDSGFDLPKDRSQDSWHQNTDTSDEFADSNKFGFDHQDSWKDYGKPRDKIPNQNVDGASTNDKIDVRVPQQEPDGRGVIEPRVGELNLDGYFDRDFDLSSENVQRWERSDLASGRYQPDDDCINICDSIRFGGESSARLKSLCNCNDSEIRHVRK